MPQNSDEYQSITKELYTKNVDLVNANKVLELIQALYEIMITSYSIESISYRFINTIADKLGFSDGLVVVPSSDGKSLEISGLTQSELNKTIMEVAGVATVNFRFDIKDQQNLLTNVYSTGKQRNTKKIYEVWTPYMKYGDVAGMDNQLILVYPIVYGQDILGSFALISANRAGLTDFEQRALDRIVTVFGIAMDRVKINERLEQAHERELAKAREIINLKDEFVFIATHDLRTPVTAIKGYSDLLKPEMEKMSSDIQEDFDAIYQSAERLDQLVEDLLEVARSESGTIYIETKPILVKEVIDRAVSEVSTIAKKKKVNITVNLYDDNCQILGDKEKLNEIFENLLSNAVKYNKEGGSVTLTSSLDVGGNVKFEVSDTGIGVPENLQEKMFSKFFRARQPGTEGIPGTGLGLFVVRMLVEKMKGTIKFESREGEGTKFIFYLPVAV